MIFSKKNRMGLLVLAVLTGSACSHNAPATPPSTVAGEPVAAPVAEMATPATTPVSATTSAPTTASGAAATSSTPSAKPAAAAPTLVWAGDLDLICEMKVKPTTRDTAHYAGKVYGFCSESCKATFLEDPAQYVQEAAAKH